MRHCQFVTRTPQAATSGTTIDLETLLALLDILDQVRSMVADLEAKKPVSS